jgi:hypothetical protein
VPNHLLQGNLKHPGLGSTALKQLRLRRRTRNDGPRPGLGSSGGAGSSLDSAKHCAVCRFTGARIVRTDWTARKAPNRKRRCRI